MSSNTKWLPLYVADYLGDTMHLTTLQHGAYMLLLMHYWRTGPLPSDNGQLAAIAKLDPKEFRGVWVVLQPFFTANGDGTLHQKRMDWELRRWDEISDKRREAGKRGAEAKHRTHPSNGGGPVTPPQPRVVSARRQPLANATVLPDHLPVDNLAIATNSPDRLPDGCQPDPGNCHPFASPFASVHSHPQSSTLSLTLAEKCARERAPARSEQKSTPDAEEVPPDNLGKWIESIEQAEAAHKASVMSREKPCNPEEQKRRVTKPRSMACHLTGEHLALARKQAGIGGAV